MSKTSAEWLNQQFLRWQLDTGKKQTLRSFSEYLSVKESSLSGWMRGTSEPTGENLVKIGERLGYGIYDVLGLERPDPIEQIETALESTPAERGEELIELVEKWLKEHGFKKQK